MSGGTPTPIVMPAHDMEPVPLWPELRGIIQQAIRTQPRSLQKAIGPSELGTPCVHCLAARLSNWPTTTQQPDWLPYIGTAVHAALEQVFNDDDTTLDTGERRWEAEKHVDVGRLQGLSGGYTVGGHIDLYDRQTGSTVDWKVVGGTTITQTKVHGPSQQYRIQASLYGIGLENEGAPVESNRIIYLPRNKVTLNDAIEWKTPYDPNPGRWALSRAQLLVNLMDAIEQADGPQMRDKWIEALPKAGPDHCFKCKAHAYPDLWHIDGMDDDASASDGLPDKWRRLIPLIEPEYNPTNK